MSLTNPGRQEFAVVLALLGALGAGILSGRHDAAASGPHPPDEVLAEDVGRHGGTLDNGLRWYVRAAPYPRQRAELRLVVNAGAVLEGDAQRGLAHAVEHMAFRGTTRFPGRAIERYLQSLGMRDGVDVNATTTQDETIYRMTVPSNEPARLDTAVAMLADMAHAATFDPAEAETERGIVLEEWRSRRDADNRLSDETDSALYAGSRYATRFTIGDTAVLRRFDLGEMRRFYDAWYRPELMAVVIVGDLDPRAAERLVRKYFGAIPASADRRVRPAVSLPRTRALRAVTLTDEEATSPRLSLWFPRPSSSRLLVREFRARVAGMLWRAILNTRLEDASDQPGSPLLSGDADARQPVRPLEAEVIDAYVAEGRVREGLDVVMGVMGGLARQGPTPAELRRQVAILARHYEQAAQWSQDAGDIADGYVHEFLSGDTFIGRSASSELMAEVLPTITAEEVRLAARAASLDNGAVLIASGPAGAAPPPADVLVSAWRDAATRAPAVVPPARVAGPLLSAPPAPGRVASERALPEISAKELTLENGMRVILKPTPFIVNQFEFRLMGSGGASMVGDRDYPSAYHADAVVRATGVGSLNGREVERLLADSAVDFAGSVYDDNIEFRGYAAPKDLELLFQVIRAHFTAARADSAAFRRYRERLASFSGHRGADPDERFADSVAAAVVRDRRRALQNSLPFLRQVELPRALGFWNARMANAASFTLVLAGDFPESRVRPLVEQYLGSLPGGVAERPRDDGVRFPAGVVRRQLVAGSAPRAKTRLVLSGPYDGQPRTSHALGAARDLAQRALAERLRETLGGTYTVSANLSYRLTPPASYRLLFQFEAAPERIDALADAALDELARLRRKGPTEEEFVRTRAALIRDLDDQVEDNDYWANELSQHARMGWPLETIAHHQEEATSLTRAELRAACASYLDASSHVRVTMFPQPAAKARRAGAGAVAARAMAGGSVAAGSRGGVARRVAMTPAGSR